MRRPSLRLRLALAGAAAVLLALALTAAGLAQLFATHVERRAEAELAVHLDQVLAGLMLEDGRLALARPPADPRFRRPYGGLYWQVRSGAVLLRSRSLWDRALALPADRLADGQVHVHDIPGPDGTRLLALEQSVVLPERLGGGTARAAVALDRSGIAAARRAFAADMAPYLGLLALALIGAGWAQLAVGLRPLGALSARVAALRAGGATRMGPGWPREVAPLAGELDALLAAREADIERARARAGDLAHGLKTPLQALLGEAGRLRARGEEAPAEAIEHTAAVMRAHVERALARARTAGRAPGASAAIAAVAERVAAVLRRTPEGRRLDWRIDIPDGLAAGIDAEDLAEALGALAENAARHACGAVTLSAEAEGERVRIAVRDDGPGIPAAELSAITRRGVRLDESGPGTGLGLAIVSEIAEAAGGRLALADARPGLRAELTLPRR